MPQGVSIFDEKLCLRVWNPGFLEANDLAADQIQEGIHFADLMRQIFPASHDEQSLIDNHVSELVEQAAAFHPYCFERTRPNGKTCLLQGEPLWHEGILAGFVTTYTDITERKQNEEFLKKQNSLLRDIIEVIPGGVSLINREGELSIFNQEFLRLLDIPDTLQQRDNLTLEQLFRISAEQGERDPNDPSTIVKSSLIRAQKQEAYSAERISEAGNTIQIQGIPLPGGHFVTFHADISAQRASEERDLLAQKVFNHTPTGIIVTDDAHCIVSSNPAANQMMGYNGRELIGHNIFAFIKPDPGHSNEVQQEKMSQRGLWHGELDILRKSGEHFPADIRVSRANDTHTGQITHFIWILVDVTERKQTEERMRYIAQHDTLTGLPNRLALLIRLAQILPDARRHDWNVAIMFIDLDRFKIINDTLGHQVGDMLLQEVACRINGAVRETDFVARLGGDEFVIILPGVASPADAAIVASKIISELGKPFQIHGHELHTSPSIGISTFPLDGVDGDTILKHADTAMYHAKSLGRNNYQFYAPEMNEAATERLDIERKLRHALKRNELSLNYQPQFNAQTRELTGVEALIRWQHPTEGLITPERFIPIAEETGLIVSIGEWVMAKACREMQHWIDSGLPPIRIAVNVSARQLRRRDFCEAVAGVLAESGLDPSLLAIEITESSVMENPQEAIEILHRLGSMGVTLAIDDFGTGYSSLSYLKLFPIDHLKIDRSFVRDIEQDPNDRAIAFGTIALAHSLGLEVVAEGVENEAQLALLQANACDEIQGFLFSKPLTSAAAFDFLYHYRPENPLH